jgi:hypothetical protein
VPTFVAWPALCEPPPRERRIHRMAPAASNSLRAIWIVRSPSPVTRINVGTDGQAANPSDLRAPGGHISLFGLAWSHRAAKTNRAGERNAVPARSFSRGYRLWVTSGEATAFVNSTLLWLVASLVGTCFLDYEALDPGRTSTSSLGAGVVRFCDSSS